MDEREALELARDAFRQSDKEGARKLLVQLVQSNPQNEIAWLWLSVIIEDPATAYLDWWTNKAKTGPKIQMTMYKSGNTWKIRRTLWFF